MNPKILERPGNRTKRLSGFLLRLSVLPLVLVGTYLFFVYAHPVIIHSSTVLTTLDTAIKDGDIDAGAYFYTENKEFFDAERAISARTEEAFAKQSKLVFASAIVMCLLMLFLFYRYFPAD